MFCSSLGLLVDVKQVATDLVVLFLLGPLGLGSVTVLGLEESAMGWGECTSSCRGARNGS